MTRSLLAYAAVALLAASIAALRAEETAAPVPIPLVVTDGRGGSIADLSAADLEITEGGLARSISSVKFHGPAPRRIVILLDEYHVTAGTHTERVRAAVTSFLDRHVRRDDTVRIVRPPDHYDETLASHGEAKLALQVFSGRKGDYTPRSPFEAQYLGTAAPLAARQRAQIVRAALESVADAMRTAEGAKALIVLTEGFEQGEPSRARTTTLRAIARAARVSNTPVYILDPSVSRPEDSPLNDAWRSIATQTGGILFEAGSSLDASFARIAADMASRYFVQFESSGKEDGGFHDIQVRAKRKGTVVRAPTGYWAPFPVSRFASPSRDRSYLRTPQTSGLIQPWVRMSPAPSGRTRVTFAWAPRPAGAKAARVNIEAITLEGDKLHASTLPPLSPAGPDGPKEVSFEALPGALQISLEILGGNDARLGMDVQYLNVTRFDRATPVISAVEFVRPRSLPEFNAMQADVHVLPTPARDFLRQDRLLVRVWAFSGQDAATVRIRLLNRLGHELLVLPALGPIGDASQFSLPFARYPRGEYRLEIRASVAGVETTQLLPIRLVG